MSPEPFRAEQIEEKATEVYITELLTLAEKIKHVREAVRKDADSLDRRLQRAGYARRLWKQTEETLPALIAEAKAAGHSVPDIAHELGVTNSYVYRVLRDQSTPAE
ncbi:hypothetical protein QA943_18760 [Streptomyces sp. B21-097]|uniref:hypothetical protein n=1 Tax=Streptomyces sp. B21-097 TaxID=3039414 RepID=UPI002FF2FD5E